MVRVVTFRVNETPFDGECGFNAMGVKRWQAIEKLISIVKNPNHPKHIGVVGCLKESIKCFLVDEQFRFSQQVAALQKISQNRRVKEVILEMLEIDRMDEETVCSALLRKQSLQIEGGHDARPNVIDQVIVKTSEKLNEAACRIIEGAVSEVDLGLKGRIIKYLLKSLQNVIPDVRMLPHVVALEIFNKFPGTYELVSDGHFREQSNDEILRKLREKLAVPEEDVAMTESIDSFLDYVEPRKDSESYKEVYQILEKLKKVTEDESELCDLLYDVDLMIFYLEEFYITNKEWLTFNKDFGLGGVVEDAKP